MGWLKTKIEVPVAVYLIMLAAVLLSGFKMVSEEVNKQAFDRCVAEQRPACKLGGTTVQMTYEEG